MKLFAETILSVVSETMHRHPLFRARDSIPRIRRNCNELPACLFKTPTRQKYPALRRCIDGTNPAKPTGSSSRYASHQCPRLSYGMGALPKNVRRWRICKHIRGIIVETIDL